VQSTDSGTISEDEVLDYVGEWSDWIDAVVITGGEPTLHSDLPSFIASLKSQVLVKLETNGTNPNMLEQMAQDNLLDCVAIDCKAPCDKLRRVTNADIQIDDILRSYQIDVPREFHTTLCPRFVNIDDIPHMASMLPVGQTWILQQYRPDDVMDISKSGRETFTLEILNDMTRAARECYDGDVRLSGVKDKVEEKDEPI
jgi:pyruvate formate lyase activating enzyme